MQASAKSRAKSRQCKRTLSKSKCWYSNNYLYFWSVLFHSFYVCFCAFCECFPKQNALAYDKKAEITKQNIL
jgi:hypothetical protein